MAPPDSNSQNRRRPILRALPVDSVRFRVSVAASLLFALASVAAAALLIGDLSEGLSNNAATVTSSAAEVVATNLREGRPLGESSWSPPLPVYFEAISPSGDVTKGRIVALASTSPQPLPETFKGSSYASPAVYPVGGERQIVSTGTVSLPSGDWEITTAAPLDSVSSSVEALRSLLVVDLPILVTLILVLTWSVTGRALRPVERIRIEAEEISASTLDRRLQPSSADDEITKLAVTLNSMLDRLETARTDRIQFVSDASHELRSPAAVIKAVAETATKTGEATPDQLRMLLEESIRLEELVTDLLTLAKGEEQKEVTKVDVDLDDICFVEAARYSVKGARRPGGDDVPVPLIDVTDVTPTRIQGDPNLLSKAVRNIVDNAVRHASSQVRVVLGVDPNGMAVLEVHDDGSGITDKDYELVFERFIRLDEARSRDKGGSGLGLPLVRSILERHGGTAEAKDSPILAGAVFTLSLPVEGPESG